MSIIDQLPAAPPAPAERLEDASSVPTWFFRPPTPYRHTRDAFEALVENGGFTDGAVKLLWGGVYGMQQFSAMHAGAVAKTGRLPAGLYASGFYIRPQLPFRVPAASQPLPDLAVVAGRPLDDILRHPAASHLIAEVCVSTDYSDRVLKPHLYAAAGVPQYWIAFPLLRTIEVHTRPAADATADESPRYDAVQTFRGGDRIPLLGATLPDAAAGDFLPPANDVQESQLTTDN